MSGSVTLSILLVVAGIVALYFGGNWLVEGSSALARRLGIRPMIVGLTVVAFGTSAPELVVSLLAAVRGTDAVAVGNVIGSNIANIALVLGVAPLVSVILVERRVLSREYLFALGISGLAWLLSLDGLIERYDGMALLGGLLVFLLWNVRTALRQYGQRPVIDKAAAQSLPPPPSPQVWMDVLKTCVGIAGLLIGAHAMVEGSVGIARFLGVPELVIGLSVVSLGTSLPEMVTSVVGAYKGEDEIAVGNILGSNVFNMGAVLGSTSTVMILPVRQSALWRDFPIMLGFTAVLFLFIRHGYRLGRVKGAVLLGGYIVYIVFIYVV